MLQLAINHSFETLAMDKITLGVFDNNESAYHCYEAIGFQEVKLDTEEIYKILGEE